MSVAVLILALAAAAPEAAIDFDTQVVPVLTRAGCNAGACHGAAIGQGGFRLSLLGERPADDYISMVHELEGRRMNLAHPEKSLLLAKPAELLEHGGGLRLAPESPGYRLLLDWLAAGAPRLQLRRLVSMSVEPRQHVVERVGQSMQLRVTAQFDDGLECDVTPWAVIAPNDSAAAEVDAHRSGLVTLKRRGQTAVLVRYLDRVAAVQIIVPLADETVDLSLQPRHNWIDDEVLAMLGQLRLPVAPQADDATFLRRARLDLTGTLPTPDEVREFLADTSKHKRARLVDRLLATPEFADFWTLKFANLLRINSNRMDERGVQAFHGWVREQIARNTPLDKVARELLTAAGDAHEVGPANFHRATTSPRDQAEHVSQVFLGARLGCANCHNHPLDRWTQDDYHGLAALFARLERGRMVQLATRGEVTHPRTGEAAVPRIPGAKFLDPHGDGRDELARWLTSDDNPYFARVWVNRVWAEMFGRGLVEPVDDLRDTNPATHPALLERLAAEFVASGYDLKRLVRSIATSAAYGRAGELQNQDAPRGRDDRFYATYVARPLAPEALLDSIVQVTGVAERYGELPNETRAIALADSKTPSPALDLLGRCSRDGACQTAAANTGLPTKLHLINGALVNEKIASPEGRLQKLLAAGRSDDQILDEFYLRALGRLPRDEERGHWRRVLSHNADTSLRRQTWEDVLWGLLNCREFSFNH